MLCVLEGQGEYAETLSTLRYADNAKKIVNKAVVNEDPNLAMIKQLKDEVKKLKQMLAAAGLLEGGEVVPMPEAQVVEKEVIVYKEDEVRASRPGHCFCTQCCQLRTAFLAGIKSCSCENGYRAKSSRAVLQRPRSTLARTG